MKDKELTIEQEVVRDCPILFRMYGRPCTETCMSFGFECGEGWHQIIADACRELEVYNSQYYPKYRVRIQADQIKEKYGTLRFYYSVVVDPNKLMTWIGRKFEQLQSYLGHYSRFDYKMKKVVDVEPYDYDSKYEITEEQYKEKTDPNYKGTICSNVEYKEENGKFFEVCHLHNYGRSHLEPTRLKMLWRIKELCNKIRCKCLYDFKHKDTAAVRNCIAFLERKVDKIVREAERECEEHCEICGHLIGTEWSPSCMTTGWITYICEECAEKQNGTYIKNGELWQGDKMLKSKEEMSKKHEAT